MSLKSRVPYPIKNQIALGNSGDGVAVQSITANLALTFLSEQFQNIAADAGRDVTLPACDARHAGVFFTIFNASAGASTLTVKDATGATIVSIPQACSAIVGSSATVWKKLIEVGTNAGASLLSSDNAWTGTQDISKSVTGTDELVNADLSINHATQVGVGVDATAVQLTTARTGGYAAAFRAKTTSLAGDVNGVPYAGLYVLAPTDGGGAVTHSGVYVAGGDYSVFALDSVYSAWGTGAAGIPDVTQGWDAVGFVTKCAVDDSTWKIGDGTLSFDVWTFGNTASDYMEWDASANQLNMRGAAHIALQTIVAATGTAIPVTHSGSFPITQNGAETNTLAIPTFLGQTLSIFVDTDTSGARVITASQRINQAANTIMTLTEVGDYIQLEAITIGGALRWQVVANDGVVLS